MNKYFFLLTILTIHLLSIELVVIGDKKFPENNLTRSEIKAIFLDKKRFIKREKILVMNHKSEISLRLCFEKNILRKTKRSIERYWRKAYYQGKRPPKIVSSINMLFLYLDSIHPAIGYSSLTDTINRDINILYRVNCESDF